MGTGPKSFKVGKRRLYDLVDLQDWIDAAKTEPPCGCSGRGETRIFCAPHLMLENFGDGAS